ncbi:MAG TPA: hypothetical protein VIV11_08520 [Kofleriaceae bacterium]
MKRIACVVIAILTTSGVAAAEGEKVTLSWSPIHLVLPVVEVEVEYNLAPNLGAGLILGAGRVTSTDGTVTATAYEVGGQFNYYFMRPFSGLHGGVEAVYLTVGDVEQDSSVTANGLTVGPYVGYKVQTAIGFAFIAQLGVQYLAVKAESSTAMASQKELAPLLNLNIGWSF